LPQIADGGETGDMARRRTAAEVQQVIQKYTESGLSQREFSEQAGIKLSTLARYVRRERRPEAVQQLVRVKLQSAGEPDSGFVLMLGNGRRIASGWEFSETALAKLIRVVERA
jgi:predicted transcriptional regulator